MSEKRYRDLIPNQDVIRESDEVDFEINDKWAPVPAHFIGQFVEEGDVPFRRPIAEPPCEHIFRLNGKCSKCGADYQESAKDSLTTEEPMQELITCPHGALHTVKCGKCENGGEVGTPRTDAIVAEYTVPEDAVIPVDFARQLEKELNGAQSRLDEQLKIAYGTDEALKVFREDNAHLAKERDEWYTVALLLHTALNNNWEHKGHPHCVCQRCTERDAALAAYELKAKEGV